MPTPTADPADRPRLPERIWAIAGGVSVRTKILGIVLGMVLLLGLGITYQVRTALVRTMEALLQEQSISVSRDLAARSADLILLNDLYALHRLLEETQRNNANVRYAFIIDQQGQILAHTFGEQFPIDLAEINTAQAAEHHHTVLIESDEGLIWDTAVPILGGQVGEARIGLSDRNVQQALRDLTGQLLLTTVLVSVIGISAAIFLTWILTRPLLDLVSVAQRVGLGDFNQRVRRWAQDEIGDLADAFNQMIVDLSRTDGLRRERESLRRQLLEKVISAQEDERKRIARELHDSTSQTLTSMIVSLRMLENSCDQPALTQQVADLRSMAGQTLEDVHSLATQLRPPILDDLGLAAALERLVSDWQARHKILVDMFIHTSDKRLPGAVETALYRIVQEALTNVARHAGQAKSVSILIDRRDESLVAVIEDDGNGFDPQQRVGERQLGLLGMRERAELLGGKLTIESTPGQGASLFIEIPIQFQEKQEVQ